MSSKASSTLDRPMDLALDSCSAVTTEKQMSAGRPSFSVLIVDDDPDLRETLRHMVASVGYDVRCVEDARAAIGIIAERQPDIIISDVYMPAGDGFELLNWLRNNGVNIPVIVMSGSSSGSTTTTTYDQLSVAEHLGASAV